MGVVVAIVGGVVVVGLFALVCMAGIMLPALGKARQSARQLKSSTQMRAIGNALMSYAMDNKGWMPETTQGWESRLTPYMGPDAAELFDSPRYTGPGPDYIYLPPPMDIERMRNAHQVIILIEDTSRLSPRELVNVLYADGHVEAVPQSSLPHR